MRAPPHLKWPNLEGIMPEVLTSLNKCPPGITYCCCQRMLYSQPDFMEQKSALEELIEGASQLILFYPKFHCELNFIEQYWGNARF